MNVARHLHPAGFPLYTLTQGDEEVVISAFGAQLLSWTKGGSPIVFENRDRAVNDGKTPYRGGAPICFPIFGMGTLLPLGTTQKIQHGQARTTIWESSASDADVTFTTRQPCPQGYGPTDFSCELTYALQDGVDIRATIRNVGEHAAPFQFAIHTYWSTSNPSNVKIEGLGRRYLDNLRGLTEHTEPDSSAPHPVPFDRIYLNDETHQELTTETYRLRIATEGCAGAVLWNPGPNHHLRDLGEPNFICLESGQIAPSKPLNPNESHLLQIRYQANLT